MSSQKLSEITATTTLGPNDLVYVVQGGNSRRITVSSLLNSLNAPVTQSSHSTVIVGSSTVATAQGTPTDIWFRFDRTIYDYCDLQFVAYDTVSSNHHSYGSIEMFWRQNGTSSGTVESMTNHYDGEEFTPTLPAVSGNNVVLRFTRSGNTSITTGTIAVRWRATLFRR